MSKFDLVQKTGFIDLVSAFVGKSKASPYELIKEKLRFDQDWRPTYFNWGRNALYYLFKSLPYKTITFPAFTCPTLTQAASKAGKNIVLTEVDVKTFNLDINRISKNTQCLVVVHTFGNPLDIKLIRKKFPKIFIIEDCAHALFSKINGKYVGGQGDVVLFSLYKQVFNINGALLLTKKKIIDEQKQEPGLKYLKKLIFKTRGIHQFILNKRRQQYLPKIEVQNPSGEEPASLTFAFFEQGFKKLEKEISQRRKVAKWYIAEARQSEFLNYQQTSMLASLSFYQFAVRLKPELAEIREKVVLGLRKKNIFVDRLWYKAPITEDKYIKEKKKFPNSLILANTVINLPISSRYSQKDVKFLFNALQESIKQQI